MYLRFLHLTIDDSRLKQARDFYERRVLPALRSCGCLFACLLQATGRAEHCASMTLWQSHEQARHWEESEACRRLLREWSELEVDPAEWRFTPLSPGGGEARAGAPPAAEGFTIEVGEETFPRQESLSRLFLRIVSMRVREDHWDELVSLYERHVVPTLLSMPGCRTALLAEGLDDPDRGLSVSIWDREEDAIRYELSGTFDSLTRRLKNTLTATRQWQTALTSEGIAEGNPPTEGFRVILGRPL